jgi:transposase
MGRRYALRDDQWDVIKGLLPGREETVGATARDNRLFGEAVLYRYRAGIPWRDLPERFGDWKNVHRRFSRWAQSGVLEVVFAHLASDADNEYAMIDSTIVRAPAAAKIPWLAELVASTEVSQSKSFAARGT